MSKFEDLLVSLGIAGAAILGIIILSKKAKANIQIYNTPPPSSSQSSSSVSTMSSSSSGINYVPASQANAIGGSAVVGTEVAVSGNSTYTNPSAVQQIAAAAPTMVLSINNSADTLTIQNAPSNQVIQVYNTQTGELVFNLMGSGTTTFTPALTPGKYVAISYNTHATSNTVTIL